MDEHTKELQWLHKKIDELTDAQNKKHAITYEEFSRLEMRITALEKKVGMKN